MLIFQPESKPQQIWVLTETYVTVVNNSTGESATVPYVWFCTELHKRGFYKRQRAREKS